MFLANINDAKHVVVYIKRMKGNERKINYVPYLKLYGLYQKIENAITYISGYSDSLLLHFTNNPAESFNSII